MHTTHWFFKPDEFSAPSLGQLRKDWDGIPDPEIKGFIAVEEQYLRFHLFLLGTLHFDARGHGDWADWRKQDQLKHSLRAGAVKSAVLMCGAIVEAALRAHGEARGYLPSNPDHQPGFQRIIEAWEQSDDPASRELYYVWGDIKKLKNHRDTIHLYKSAEDASTFTKILTKENDLLDTGKHVIDNVKSLYTRISR